MLFAGGLDMNMNHVLQKVFLKAISGCEVKKHQNYAKTVQQRAANRKNNSHIIPKKQIFFCEKNKQCAYPELSRHPLRTDECLFPH